MPFSHTVHVSQLYIQKQRHFFGEAVSNVSSYFKSLVKVGYEAIAGTELIFMVQVRFSGFEEEFVAHGDPPTPEWCTIQGIRDTETRSTPVSQVGCCF